MAIRTARIATTPTPMCTPAQWNTATVWMKTATASLTTERRTSSCGTAMRTMTATETRPSPCRRAANPRDTPPTAPTVTIPPMTATRATSSGVTGPTTTAVARRTTATTTPTGTKSATTATTVTRDSTPGNPKRVTAKTTTATAWWTTA